VTVNELAKQAAEEILKASPDEWAVRWNCREHWAAIIGGHFAGLEAEAAAMRSVLQGVLDTLQTELNPCNYNDDDVCRLNAEATEVVLSVRKALAESTAGAALLERLQEAERQAGKFEQRVERLLNVARGCLDYGGGYRGRPVMLEVFHHGIQTVIDALEAAEKNDPNDTQVNALERIGCAEVVKPAPERTVVLEGIQPR
jgi:hypothetical protein